MEPDFAEPESSCAMIAMHTPFTPSPQSPSPRIMSHLVKEGSAAIARSDARRMADSRRLWSTSTVSLDCLEYWVEFEDTFEILGGRDIVVRFYIHNWCFRPRCFGRSA